MPAPIAYDIHTDAHVGPKATEGGVALVTQASLFKASARLRAQAKAWACPVSIALYIPGPRGSKAGDDGAKQAAKLHRELLDAGQQNVRITLLYAARDTAQVTAAQHAYDAAYAACTSSPGTCDWAALQAAVQDEYTDTYPTNALRNAAANAAPQPLVYLLDADFIPSPGLCAALEGRGAPAGASAEDVAAAASTAAAAQHVLTEAAAGRRAALVTTVFMVKGSAADVPKTFDELKDAFGKQDIRIFQFPGYLKGQLPSRYEKFFDPDPQQGGAYQVDYSMGYEPYVIVARHLLPPADERFRGYGRNKIAHLHRLGTLGYRFYVLRRQFAVHLNHGHKEDADRSQTLMTKSSFDVTTPAGSQVSFRPVHNFVMWAWYNFLAETGTDFTGATAQAQLQVMAQAQTAA